MQAPTMSLPTEVPRQFGPSPVSVGKQVPLQVPFNRAARRAVLRGSGAHRISLMRTWNLRGVDLDQLAERRRRNAAVAQRALLRAAAGDSVGS